MPPAALIFTPGTDVFSEQGHVLPGGAAGGEAGGGLDVIGTGGGDDLAHLDLFLLSEQAGLHDDLEDAALAALLDLSLIHI